MNKNCVSPGGEREFRYRKMPLFLGGKLKKEMVFKRV